jgi:hypothetical protein
VMVMLIGDMRRRNKSIAHYWQLPSIHPSGGGGC